MNKLSAGLLLFRRKPRLEIFLVHPGGPFFRDKDEGAWSIPKGEVEDGDEALPTARREFHEETGFEAPEGNYRELGEIRQKGGKRVAAWAIEGDCDQVLVR
jgi:predicted NUDIX family NTP pyrophosphohydrolase